MANPAAFQILDLIAARLENMTVANGYFFDVKKIKRATTKPPDGIDYPSVRYWVSSSQNGVDGHNFDKRSLSLFIEYRNKTYDEPFNDVCWKLESDVINGINRDVLTPKVSDTKSINLGGVVSGVDWTNTYYQIGNNQNPFCGVLINLDVSFYADLNEMEVYSG